MNEYMKAFNIIISLHDKMKKSLNIIKEAPGFHEEDFGSRLYDQFNQIASATRDLAKSRRLQSLIQSQFAYRFPSKQIK